jgi:N-acetyl-anhydromuramyl-L-alanine amidase AmpD
MTFFERILQALGWRGGSENDVVSQVQKLAGTPAPLADPLPPLKVGAGGWLVGEGVKLIQTHPSWYYEELSTAGKVPRAIVAHYTATDPGTAERMAQRRTQPWANFAKEWKVAHPDQKVPQNSWHISIEADGRIIQMAPLTAGCWHAGGPTAKRIPGLGAANYVAVGIELVGHGKVFTPEQVDAACRVWRAICKAYPIDRRDAMWQHSTLDPTRRADPGPVWMENYATKVLDYSFAP